MMPTPFADRGEPMHDDRPSQRMRGPTPPSEPGMRKVPSWMAPPSLRRPWQRRRDSSAFAPSSAVPASFSERPVTTEATDTPATVEEDLQALAEARLADLQSLHAHELATLRDRLAELEVRAESLERQLELSRDANRALVQAVARARESAFADSEGDVLRLAVGVARRVVAAELQVPTPIVQAWVREAIALCATSQGLVLAISSDLASALDGAAWSEAAGSVPVQVDPTLEGLVCELRGAESRAVLSAEARLGAMAEALGVDP